MRYKHNRNTVHVQIAVRITPATRKKLEDISNRRETWLSDVCRQALDEFIRRDERRMKRAEVPATT